MLKQFPNFDIPDDAQTVFHDQQEIVELVLPKLKWFFPGVQFDVDHVRDDDAEPGEECLLEIDAETGTKVWRSGNREGGWYIGVPEAPPEGDEGMLAMRCFARGYALCLLFYPHLYQEPVKD